MRRFTLLFILSLTPVATWAAVPFFRKPTSPIPSGYANAADLQQQTSQVRTIAWLKVRYHGQSGWIPQTAAATLSDSKDRQMAVITASTVLRQIPSLAGIELTVVKPGNWVKIIKAKRAWLLAEFHHHHGYLQRSKVWTLENSHHGAFALLTSGVRLRQNPSWQSPQSEWIPAGTTVACQGSFVQEWGFATHHGVWWPLIEFHPTPMPVKMKSTAQLFSQKIYDVVSSPVIPKLTFVSANGIYRSTDGVNWEKLNEFGDNNYPLAISHDGIIYVGAQRSFDQGLSFKNYIHWDQLIHAVGSPYPVSLNNVRILKIDFGLTPRDQICLTLAAGTHRFQVAGLASGANWFLLSRNRANSWTMASRTAF